MRAIRGDWFQEHGPLNTRDLRSALGAFATGVTIVAAAGVDGRPVGCTASSFNTVSLDPPLVLWSLARNALSLRAFRACSHFAVSVLAADQKDIAMQFANPPATGDKFAGVAVEEGLGGAPVLRDSLAQFECANEAQIPGGDHIIFIGRIERYRWHDGDPLLFYRGGFPTLG